MKEVTLFRVLMVGCTIIMAGGAAYGLILTYHQIKHAKMQIADLKNKQANNNNPI